MAEESKEKESDEEDQPQQQEEENEVEDQQTVENIEEQTEGGLLGSYSKEAVLAGGLMLGLALGLIVGYGAVSADPSQVQEANPDEVKNSIEQYYGEILELQGMDDGSLEVQDPERINGMFYLVAELEVPEIDQETGEELNGTEQIEEGLYVSIDGELLFPELPGQSPVNIEQQLEQIEQQRQMQEEMGDIEIDPEEGEVPEEDIEIEEE